MILWEQFGVALQPDIVVQPFGENDTDVTFIYTYRNNPKYSCRLFSYNLISTNRITSFKQIAEKGYNVHPLY